MIGKLTPMQEVLYDQISAISEERYCSGWYRGIERVLWVEMINALYMEFSPMNDKPMKWELQKLWALSRRIGGWITWREEADNPEFVSTKDWLKEVEKRR